MELPKSVVLKSNSNGKYIWHVQDGEQTFLEFCGEDVFSPYGNYEIEPAQRSPPNHRPIHRGQANQAKLVHIRCRYNNKYWVRQSEDQNWIVAKASRPDEDRSKWSCTLFEPIFAETNIVQFRHVQLQSSLSMEEDCLSLASTEPAVQCVFINWDSLLKLPRYIVFKGDNGCYLSGDPMTFRQHKYMHFTSGTKGERAVMNEVFVAGDGYVRIKSRVHDKFWKRDPETDWIWADSDDDRSGSDFNVLFKPVEIRDNVIALRNVGNNLFCRRLNTCFLRDCLSATAANIEAQLEAQLRLEEPLKSRKIEYVRLYHNDARIYSINSVTVANEKINNMSPTESLTVELDLSHSRTHSGSWTSTISKKLGLKATIKAGIPTIVNGDIEISGERSIQVEWGEIKSTTIQVTRKTTKTVPPRTTVKARVWAKEGSFEVPFSYTQIDTLTTGEHFSYTMEDGVYIGDGYFDFKVNFTSKAIN